MLLDDVRKAIEATLGNMTPARAQELAKGFLGPGAAKEQVAKTAAEMMDWSQRNRGRLREFIDHEITRQLKAVGVARQSEVDGLKRRVRELERAAGMTASGSKTAAKRKPAGRKPAGRKRATRKPPPSETAARTPVAPTTTTAEVAG